MRKFREGLDRKQLALLPASVDDYIGKNDLVRYVDTLVDEFDLSSIEEAYSSFGRPAYNPRILVKIIVYGKMRSIRSSRQLAEAARENLRFIFLANNEKPDSTVISRFRRSFHQELASLLKQTIGIGLKEGLIDLDHVCVDGTKLRAFAGRNSFQTPEKLEAELLVLEKVLEASFAEDVKNDEEDESKDDQDPGLPLELQDKRVLREKLKAALKHYSEVEGEKPKKVSVTDPESRYMKSKGTQPSYNAQAAIDTKQQLAVGGFANNAGSDHSQLSEMLEEIEENTGSNPEMLSTDKGYSELKALFELKERNIDGYIPRRIETDRWFALEDFQYDPEKDIYVCPNNKTLKLVTQTKKHKQYQCESCNLCPLREKCLRKPNSTRGRTLSVSIHIELLKEMRAKTQTELAKQIAKIRGHTVEPVFGHLKYNKKLQQFLFRGVKMVDSMWKLELAAYNLHKIATYRMKNLPVCG